MGIGLGGEKKAAGWFRLSNRNGELWATDVKYTPAEEIAKAARGGQAGNWVQIHRRVDVMYANDNIELPSLNPWVNTTAAEWAGT